MRVVLRHNAKCMYVFPKSVGGRQTVAVRLTTCVSSFFNRPSYTSLASFSSPSTSNLIPCNIATRGESGNLRRSKPI